MINSEIGEIKTERLVHTEEEFRKFIGDKAGTTIVIESCWNWAKTYELAKDLVEELILTHPLYCYPVWHRAWLGP